MTHPPSTPHAIVVCPLEFERQALCRAGLERLARIHCCGPGASAAAAWAEQNASECSSASLVILAGLAGALRAERAAGSAFIADVVVNAQGERFAAAVPDLRPHALTLVTSSLHAVCSVAEKQELARNTGAQAVDLESAAFAQQAAMRGWRWAVVRGISDDARTSLPDGVEQWTDAQGRTRRWRVAASLLRRPTQIGAVIRLGRDSAAAMRTIATLVRTLIEQSSQSLQDPDPDRAPLSSVRASHTG